MAVVAGALGSLIPKLQKLFHGEYKLQIGVKEKVYFICNELESMHPVLRKVAEVPPDMVSEQVKNWAREAREASYNIEDRIDTFLVSVVSVGEPIDKTGCWWLKRAKKKMGDLPSKGSARADIASAIEDIMKQLQELDQLRDRCRFDDIVSRPLTSTSSTVDPRLPALYRNERELVGIEEAREDLVRLLTQGDPKDDEKRKVKAVCVVGLAGVGKTTLAKAVYNSLQAQFNCSAFVSVSRKPDLKKVFRDILLELDESKYQTAATTKLMDEKQLINEIREFLRNKRYLIVIDDIWDVEAWSKIRSALYDGVRGSQIITTSRISHVKATYIINPLSHVNSEKLFYKRIFGGDGNCPDIKLAEVSDKILKKCCGLPLAIITVASVLANQPPEKWSEVYNSVVLRHESNRYVDNMGMVLSFSYYDLPVRLRTCLLHLSLFPEDCFIEKDLLIWMWVAEGFVERRQGISLFEAGESYFNDLVNRSMIQVPEECVNNGLVYGCRVHPVLLSQIRVISSEENFCTVLEDEHHTSAGNNNSRRIAMHSIRNVEHNMEKVRSFYASLCFIEGMPQLSSFQVLRVLALEYCPVMDSYHHLKQIGNLVHLRYLGLVGAGVLELPEETLGGLRFLQTLDLRETEIEQLPRTIPEQLVCLCVHRTRTVAEGMMRSLTSLEDLRLLHVTGDIVQFANELGMMQELRVLVLGFEKMDDELKDVLLLSLARLHKIHHLEIYCEQSTSAAWEGTGTINWLPPRVLRQLVLGGQMFTRLPSWINPPYVPNLSHLHLGVEVLEDGDLETLARFPMLRSLVLMAAAGDEQEHRITTVVAPDDGAAFWGLYFFSTNMPVSFERGTVPNLEQIEFRLRVAQIAGSWLSSLVRLSSLKKVTVVLDCRGASATKTEEAEETLRHATAVHPNHPKLQVTKENGNDEVPLIEQFRFKNPRFEALRSEMEKMHANRQVQVQPDNDSDEIVPAKADSRST